MKGAEADQPTLPLSLPGSAVHLVVDDTSLRVLEGVLRERLSDATNGEGLWHLWWVGHDMTTVYHLQMGAFPKNRELVRTLHIIKSY